MLLICAHPVTTLPPAAAEDDVDIEGEADESELAGTGSGAVTGGSAGTGVHQLMSERRRTGRQATDTRHITMAMLEEGGYFDMPLKVLLPLCRGLFPMQLSCSVSGKCTSPAGGIPRGVGVESMGAALSGFLI